MKKYNVWSVILLLGLFFIVLCGMSGMGATPEQPAANSIYSATIVDISNNNTTITSATIDGKTSFSGYLGKGRVQIPFENIAHIELQKSNACVSLTDGSKICDLNTNKISRLSGNTSFGTYSIRLEDIKSIEFMKIKK